MLATSHQPDGGATECGCNHSGCSRCSPDAPTQPFEEYFNSIFAPYILRQLEDAKRIDIVWDVYKDDSLKKAAREKRGSGQRRKVMLSTRIPSDWKRFLRVDDNKDELFKLLATKVRV